MKWVILGFLSLSAVPAQEPAAAQARTAFDLNERGLAAEARGGHAEAERLYDEAIGLWRALGPPYEAHLSSTQVNLAQCLSGVGRREEAIRILETALAGFRKSLGSEHLRTLTTQNELGAALLVSGDEQRAATLLGDALTIERRLYPNDLELAHSLDGWLSLLLRQGRVAEALQPAEEALSIVLKTDGDRGLNAALAYSNVAEAHRMAGRPERALPLYRKSRALYESILGPAHPRVAGILSQEGLILMAEGKLALAEKNMKEAQMTMEKSCPACVFERMVVEINLGVLRMKQRKYAEADQLLTHVVSVQERYWTKPGSLMAATLRTLAEVREKERRPEEAARLQKRADLILAYR